ncbi:MAG: T9SS type A sorting domain-containing protein [Bacteroidia bacterium]|nr:T9SS type A sorting domain-containing protein [Bacteroidia bacterium]
MKNFIRLAGLTLFVSYAIYLSSASGQCIPDTSITHNVPGIYPDSLQGIPYAYVGTPYQTTLQFKVPVDTTYNGLPATIDSIVITGITGLPATFSYSCTPSSCSFPGNSNGCVLIQGPAPTSNMIGIYPLTVDLMVYGKVTGVPLSIPSSNDNYTLYIDNNISTGGISVSRFGVGQNQPNPARNFTEIPVSLMNHERIEIRITNLLGSVVFRNSYNLPKGISRLRIPVSGLDSGIYLYTVIAGRNTSTQRMVVSNN